MKIRSAFDQLSTTFRLNPVAINTQKNQSLGRRKLILDKKPHVLFPSLPWLEPNLAKLKWSKLKDAYCAGTMPEHCCKEKEHAMLLLVEKALSCNKSIELMMVSFSKG